MRRKKPRRVKPPTLLHRTLVFPLGRAGPRPEAEAFRARTRFAAIPQARAGFGAAVDDPKEASRRAS